MTEREAILKGAKTARTALISLGLLGWCEIRRKCGVDSPEARAAERVYDAMTAKAEQQFDGTIAAYDAAHAPERPGQEAQNLADARACGHGDQDDQT